MAKNMKEEKQGFVVKVVDDLDFKNFN